MDKNKSPFVNTDDSFIEISIRLVQPVDAALREEAKFFGHTFSDYYLYLISEEFDLHYEAYFGYMNNSKFDPKKMRLSLSDLPDFGLDDRVFEELMMYPNADHPIHMRKTPKEFVKVSQFIMKALKLNKSDDWSFRYLSQKIAIRRLLPRIRKMVGK